VLVSPSVNDNKEYDNTRQHSPKPEHPLTTL